MALVINGVWFSVRLWLYDWKHLNNFHTFHFYKVKFFQVSGGKGVILFLAYFTFHIISRQKKISTKIDEHFFEHWNVNRHFSLGNQQCYAALRLYRNWTENHNHFYHLSITENWMVICHNRSDNQIVFRQTVKIQLYSCLTIQFGWPWKTLFVSLLSFQGGNNCSQQYRQTLSLQSRGCEAVPIQALLLVDQISMDLWPSGTTKAETVL